MRLSLVQHLAREDVSHVGCALCVHQHALISCPTPGSGGSVSCGVCVLCVHLADIYNARTPSSPFDANYQMNDTYPQVVEQVLAADTGRTALLAEEQSLWAAIGGSVGTFYFSLFFSCCSSFSSLFFSSFIVSRQLPIILPWLRW
jgi:hypothetical protein